MSKRNLLLTLQHLVQEASVAATPQKRAQGIVSQIKTFMEVEVSSLYLFDGINALTLVATEGLHAACVGKIALNLGEGLVGTIGKTQHLLNVERASKHPSYRYFPESGEDNFDSFLGAPVVHGGKLVGVLVAEQTAHRRFSEDEESFLITAAAHLGTLHPSDFKFQSQETTSSSERPSDQSRHEKGIPAAPGVGIGRIVLLSSSIDLMSVSDTESSTSSTEHELSLFRSAITSVRQELTQGKDNLTENISEEVAEMFDVYDLILQSSYFSGETETSILKGYSAASALRKAVSKQAEKFEAIDDAYLRSRVEDIHNLGNRVYAHLCQSQHIEVDEHEQVILAGGLVSIADIANYPAKRLAGVISADGSSLSHMAVLAKALGIPAVLGVRHLSDFRDGEEVVMDGHQGDIYLSPKEDVKKHYLEMMDLERSLYEKLTELKELPAETLDGVRFKLQANTGLMADISPGLSHGAEGVGLYRSEIPFLISEAFPSEEEQQQTYRFVLESYRGMPVSMRTLDVGGDKPLPYYQFQEENPALGLRGIRFTMDNTVIFMTQLRAMLWASSGLDNLRIILPMIGSIEEVDNSLGLIQEAVEQLTSEGFSVKPPLIGIMAEVPSIISILPFLKGKIDFVSIGSNDLCQYLLAVDRNNPRVTNLFNHLHPAVIEAVEKTTQRSSAIGVPVSVCGEMAADPYSAVLLIGMGVETLSMVAHSIPRIKRLIRSISQKEAQQQLALAKTSSNPTQTRIQLKEFLIEQGLEDIL